MERERVVAPDDAQVVPVLVDEPRDGRLDARAEGALVVAPHHDGDEGVVGPALRGVLGHGRAEALDLGGLTLEVGRADVGVGTDVGEGLLAAAARAADQVADGQPRDESDQDRDDRRTFAHD